MYVELWARTGGVKRIMAIIHPDGTVDAKEPLGRVGESLDNYKAYMTVDGTLDSARFMRGLPTEFKSGYHWARLVK